MTATGGSSQAIGSKLEAHESVAIEWLRSVDQELADDVEGDRPVDVTTFLERLGSALERGARDVPAAVAVWLCAFVSGMVQSG